MKKALILGADPETPPIVASEGFHDAGGHGGYSSESAIFEVGDAVVGGNPNSPLTILKERIHYIVRQSTASLAVDSNPPIVPSVQTIPCAKPDAAIPVRQDRHDRSIG